MSGRSGRGRRTLGPYETWVHVNGRAFQRDEPALAKAAYIGATVECGPGDAPPSGIGRQGDRTPLLWTPAFDDPGRRRTWPVLLKEPADLPRFSTKGAGKPAAGPRVRLNARVADACVDPRSRTETTSHGRPAAARAAGGRAPAIIAVIDDGMPFAHAMMLDGAGRTRIEYHWDQGARSAGDGAVLFGREWRGAAIDALRARFPADEDGLYRAGGGAIDRNGLTIVDRHGNHGAHVLGLAAGRDGSDADALDHLRVVTVSLPTSMTIDTGAFGKDFAVLSAFHYVFERAEHIAERWLGSREAPIPLVINFSYGFTGGPHDGSDRLEAAIGQLIERRRRLGRPTRLFMPSGNSFQGRLFGVLAAEAVAGPGGAAIAWRLQPNDRTSNYLEIWFPEGAAGARFLCAVRDPGGREVLAKRFTLDADAADHAWTLLGSAGRTIGQWSLERYRPGLWRIVIAIAPTEPEAPHFISAAAGLWTVTLSQIAGRLPPGSVLSLRIQRDTDPYGYQRGARQSYLDDPADAGLDAFGSPSEAENGAAAIVRRFGTLNGLATHAATDAVAGYLRSCGRPSAYSSAGLVDAGAGARVRWSAPADDSFALPGIMGEGPRSGARFRLSGTSVAAPQAARSAALGKLPAAAPGPPSTAARARLGVRLTNLGDAAITR